MDAAALALLRCAVCRKPLYPGNAAIYSVDVQLHAMTPAAIRAKQLADETPATIEVGTPRRSWLCLTCADKPPKPVAEWPQNN